MSPMKDTHDLLAVDFLVSSRLPGIHSIKTSHVWACHGRYSSKEDRQGSKSLHVSLAVGARTMTREIVSKE